MKKSVCVIIRNGDKIVSVSRKDDHQDFGLIGGKVEEIDPTTELAAIRETKEETGLDAYNLELVDEREWDGYYVYCYTANASGFINYKENHVVKELYPIELTSGCFGEYNKTILTKLGLLKEGKLKTAS